MIDRQKEFKENLEALKKENTVSYEKGFPKQNEIMDSLRLNESMKNIETTLNGLYEKTRALEDAMDYAKTFLRGEISSRRQVIKRRIDEIESSRDSMKDAGYRARVVALSKRKGKGVRDRDGSVVASCGISNSRLTLSGQILEGIIPTAISRKISNQSNGELFRPGEVSRYMASYREEEPISGGITEDVLFHFGTVQNLGSIELTPMNCEVIEIAFINKNDAEEIVPQSQLYIFQPIEAKGIRARLRCNNPRVAKISKSNVGRSPWQTAKEETDLLYERNAKAFIEESRLDRESRAYSKFKQDFEDNQALEQRNVNKELMKKGLGRS